MTIIPDVLAFVLTETVTSETTGQRSATMPAVKKVSLHLHR